MEDFKITLAAARINAGLSQQDIASEMHVSRATIINWERGKVVLKPAEFKMFCEICKAPVDCIILPKA